MPCEGTKRYVQNYMSVVDLRPATDEDLVKHEDELYSDEELDPRIVDAATRRKTRVEGAPMEREDRRTNAVAEGEKEKSREAMARGDAAWGESMGEKRRKRQKREGSGALKWDDGEVQRAQAAAAASRAQEGSGQGEAEGGPQIVAGKRASAASVCRWKHGLADKGLNAAQRSVVEKVADRVLAQEFSSPADGKRVGQKRANMEPLLWVLHGGPGTGKSYVIDKIRKELFEEEMGWTHGIDFQVAALQATNASALDGNTIHSAFGMGVNTTKGPSAGADGEAEAKKKTKKEVAAQRMAQWKWLIVDEVSMVSANFLAELDSHLRSRMSAASDTKVGADGMDRPFGGINVLFCGDFYQLEPPSGTAINALPTSYLKNARKYAPGATEDHGQHIFWGRGGVGAVQGMTELTECKRVEEPDT